MTALLDAMTRGFARGVVAVAVVGVLAWALDKVLGGRR